MYPDAERVRTALLWVSFLECEARCEQSAKALENIIKKRALKVRDARARKRAQFVKDDEVAYYSLLLLICQVGLLTGQLLKPFWLNIVVVISNLHGL